MPSLIPVDRYRDKIDPLLVPGEQPVLAEGVQESLGTMRIERPREDELALLPPALRDVMIRAGQGAPAADTRNALERMIDVSVFPVFQLDPGIGREGHGGVGSIAHAFQLGLDKASTGCLLVTTTRLLLVEQRVSDPWQLLAGASRAAIAGARSKPHLVQRGRLLVDFVDASQASFLTGFLFGGAARRLADALSRR